VSEHRADREAGSLVYPVISRRSGGLSLGINLFPDAKLCSFDCPYCEVFPPASGIEAFSIEGLEEELEDFLGRAYPGIWAPEPVRDICFSGNGEPSASPRLAEALDLCVRAKRRHPDLLGHAALVLITNSTGFLEPTTFELLERFVREEGLVVWAKLDAGNDELFRIMSGTRFSLERIVQGILVFARLEPVVVQTMLCEVAGRRPSEGDMHDYARLIVRLVREGARIDELHLYTFARPTPDGQCAALSDEELVKHADLVRGVTRLPVRVFGRVSELAATQRLEAPGRNPEEVGRG
jgi:histidinol dehydrogenase